MKRGKNYNRQNFVLPELNELSDFNWRQFLVSNKIEFIDRGPNVSRGNLNVQCPWCGDADASQHLGININGRGFGCWRNSSHRGKNPRRLVQALLGCSYQTAENIVNKNNTVFLDSEASFMDQINQAFFDTAKLQNLLNDSNLDDELAEFRLINYKGLSRFFFDYICKRGYTQEETSKLIKDYELRFTLNGIFAYRIIIPVRMEQGVVTWTGRAISDAIIRYRTLTTDHEKSKTHNVPTAVLSIKDCLWNYSDLLDNPGDNLIVVEGPFDSLRLDFFGKNYGTRATCLFSKTISKAQLILLDELSCVYKRKYLLLDSDAKFDYLWMLDDLKYFGFQPLFLPKGVNDPAELMHTQIQALFTRGVI